MSIHRRLDRQNVVQTCNGILLSCKENAICRKMSGYEKYNIKWDDSPYLLRQGLLLNLKLVVLAKLSGLQDGSTYPGASQHWSSRHAPSSLASPWVLVIGTQVLLLMQRALHLLGHPTSPLLSVCSVTTGWGWKQKTWRRKYLVSHSGCADVAEPPFKWLQNGTHWLSELWDTKKQERAWSEYAVNLSCYGDFA